MKLVVLAVTVLFVASFSSGVDENISAPFGAADFPAFPPAEQGTAVGIEYGINVFIKDSQTARPISGMVAKLDFINGQLRVSSVQLTSSSGNLPVFLTAGNWNLTAEIIDPTTPGEDYFATGALVVASETNYTLFLQPVGSVNGMVYDDQNRSVQGANLKMECVSSQYDFNSINTLYSDEFGAFSLKYVPVGRCRLLSSLGEKVGAQEIIVKKGELSTINVSMLSERTEEGRDYSPYVFAVLIVLGTIVLVVLLVKQKKVLQHVKQEPSVISSKIPKTSKMTHILSTLKSSESRVVEFLLESAGHSTQARIYNKLLIPKVSLSRIIYSLESKNIVKTSKFGKIKKIELSEWFLKEK